MNNGVSCCGVGDLANICDDEKPEDTLLEVSPGDQGVVIFTDVGRTKYKYGNRLQKKIEELKLGTIEVSGIFHNPNHRSRVRMWTWHVNRPALRKWQQKWRKANPEPEYDNFWGGGYNRW